MSRLSKALRSLHWRSNPLADPRGRALYRECIRPEQISILPKHKLIHFAIGKCACTSVKAMLAEAEGVKLDQPREIHLRREPSLRVVGTRTFFDVHDDPDALVFSFVRHPISRTLSLYKDKIAPYALSAPQAPQLYRQYFSAGEIRRLNQDAPLPFPMFVELVTETCATTDDDHWALMDRMLPTSAVKFTFIGRVETIDEDIRPVMERLGCDALPRLKRSGDRPLISEPDLTPDLKRKIVNAYARDFERFGYEP